MSQHKSTVQPPENETARTETSKHHNRGRWAVLIVVVLLLLGSISAVFLSQKSLHKATVAGVSVASNATEASIASSLEAKTASYAVNVSYPDGSTKSFTLEKLGITPDLPATAAAAIEAQNTSNYFVRAQWWSTSAVPLSVTINEKKFTKALQTSITRSSKKPTNAKITIKNGKAKLAAEKSGVGYTVPGGRDEVLKAIEQLQAEPLQAKDQDLPAAITKTEAQPVFEKVKAILVQKVVIKIDGRSNTASDSTIGKWIELSPVPSSKTIDISVNSGKVLKYINGVAAPYVQPPRSEVVLKKSNGQTQVLVAGKSGVDVVRKNELASKVAKQALVAKGVSESADINYAPFKRISARSYPKWLVADVTNKRMYAYENNKLVRTFLISAGAPGTPTVLGQYAIRSKVRIQDMRGNNVDGSRYFQPDVEYVNYFYADYAIHGNYWRPTSYFGNVNSSHGCIGIVNSDAAWIYSWAPIGTPVIVHS